MPIRIAATSDLHGHLPPTIPECDVLIIAGDICGHSHPQLQANWLEYQMRPWLERIPATEVVICAGNHDWVFEKRPDLVPKDLRWHYLEDSGTEVCGLKLWGSAYTPWYNSWAFNAPMEDDLRADGSEPFLDERFSRIPGDTDILLTHGPAYGYGDRVLEGHCVGSRALLRHIIRVQPTLHVCGHIHEGYGEYRIGNTRSANVSLCDRSYHPVNPVVTFEV